MMISKMFSDSGDTWRRMIRAPWNEALSMSAFISHHNLIGICTGSYSGHKTSPALRPRENYPLLQAHRRADSNQQESVDRPLLKDLGWLGGLNWGCSTRLELSFKPKYFVLGQPDLRDLHASSKGFLKAANVIIELPPQKRQTHVNVCVELEWFAEGLPAWHYATGVIQLLDQTLLCAADWSIRACNWPYNCQNDGEQ